MAYLKKLMEKWELESVKQVIIILIVFALTGSTVLIIKRPIFEFASQNGEVPTWVSVVYYVLILPIYNLFLLAYGFLFGQFNFFLKYEKRMLKRMRIIK